MTWTRFMIEVCIASVLAVFATVAVMALMGTEPRPAVIGGVGGAVAGLYCALRIRHVRRRGESNTGE